jgi:hypothetical protein
MKDSTDQNDPIEAPVGLLESPEPVPVENEPALPDDDTGLCWLELFNK